MDAGTSFEDCDFSESDDEAGFQVRYKYTQKA